jgi:pSer/pThr/pTyr-binding forkhead associated (FHA) protein
VPLRFRVRPPASAGALSAVERTVDVDQVAGPITLGRRAGLEIQLPFATVSGRHARIAGGPGRWTIEDLGSANGTFVVAGRGADAAAERLRPGEVRSLPPGAMVRLADVTVVFEGAPADVGAAAEGLSESTGTLARRLVSDFFGACRPAEVARVLVEAGPDAGLAISLTTVGRCYRVGRAAECDLVLTDEDVSREHAGFERRWDAIEVRDLDSKNGVQVGDKRVHGPHRLRDGETVTLGNTRLRLEDPEDRYLRQIQEEDGRRTAAGDPDAEPPAPAPPLRPEAARGEVRERRPGRRSTGPIVIAAVALVVLAGISALVAWLLLGDWQ